LKIKENSCNSAIITGAGTLLKTPSFARKILGLGEVEGARRGGGPDSAAEAARERGTIWHRGMLGEAGEERRRADGRGS